MKTEMKDTLELIEQILLTIVDLIDLRLSDGDDDDVPPVSAA